MAQGAGLKKLKKATKSAGGQRRKAKAMPSKGRKHKKEKRVHAVAAARPELQVTKQINRRNEALVAAKAIASGHKFSLKDISERGSKEHQQQMKARDKKQDKSHSLTGRLKNQIQQLQQGTKTR